MNWKPIDLISLEIHIHLKIKGEYTLNKTFVIWSQLEHSEWVEPQSGRPRAAMWSSSLQSWQKLQPQEVCSPVAGGQWLSHPMAVAPRLCKRISWSVLLAWPTRTQSYWTQERHLPFIQKPQHPMRGPGACWKTLPAWRVLFLQTWANTAPGAHLDLEKYSFPLCLWS